MKRLWLLVLLMSVTVGRAPAAQIVPTGFFEDILATRLSNPTDFAFLPDGRILIAEKDGVVRVYKDGAMLAAPLIDLRGRVNDYWDRGLTAIAADPDFLTNGFVYLFYVYENDAADYNGAKTARLTRVTVSGDTAQPATETVLLGSVAGASCGGLPVDADCIPADSPMHAGGTIKFAADKTIFVTTGDGASFNIIDPLSLRAQDLDSYAGKLLRITRMGQGVSTNPFWTGNPSAIRSKVWAYGFRNPLRATLRPGTEQPYVADEGLSSFEELDVAIAGANLGWPCYEGPARQPGFQAHPQCQSLYQRGDSAVKPPLVWYRHDDMSSAIIGGTFYTGTVYPPPYQGAYFFGDYAQGFLKYLRVDTNDALSGAVTYFGSGASGPLKIDTGPGGDLYYVATLSGELRHLRYVIGQPASTQPLSSLEWTRASNGSGPVERDLSTGKGGTDEGHPITINGSVYATGLRVHAPSEIRYRLDGACTSFATDMGLDDEVGSGGSVTFQVRADGIKLYDSGVVTGATPARSIALSMTARQELALIVKDGRDGNSADLANWADASITCGSAGLPLFAPAVSMHAGPSMHAVAIADLNGDSKLDIVAVSARRSLASIWLGNGDGTFGERADFPTGRTPKSVAVADVNRDGHLDLVIADQDASTISVLLGSGSGSFAIKREYAACSFAHETAIADFNGDGWPDVVVACWGGNVVSVLLNRGDGTFAPKTDLPTGLTPTSVVARDFDNDGSIDLAVANHGGADVSILRGRGDGRFDPEVRYGTGQAPHAIRSDDVNGDGLLDLVTANESSNSVSVLLGREDGSFAAAVSYPVGWAPKGVLIADLDGDGLLDMLSTNTAGNYPNCCFHGGDTVTLLHGNGDGTFAAAETYSVGTTPFAAAAGDLDRDGRLDVITANWHSNDVTILHNIGGRDSPRTSPDTTRIFPGAAATIPFATMISERFAPFSKRSALSGSHLAPTPRLRE